MFHQGPHRAFCSKVQQSLLRAVASGTFGGRNQGIAQSPFPILHPLNLLSKIRSEVSLSLLYAFSSDRGQRTTNQRRLPRTWPCIKLYGKGDRTWGFYTAQLNSPGQETREGLKVRVSGRSLNLLELEPTHKRRGLNSVRLIEARAP